MGGDAHPGHSPPANISDMTSSSQPLLTPSRNSLALKEAYTGVGKMSYDEGGLLAELLEDDSGGVDGTRPISAQSVSMGKRSVVSCWIRIAGFWCVGRGEATGVSIDCGA